MWDHDGNGFITKNEFLSYGKEKPGLLEWVRRNLLQEPQTAPLAMPELDSSPEVWFDFFDDDHTGTLSHDKMVRGAWRSAYSAACQEPLRWHEPLA